MTLLLVRHASAGDREAWVGDDRLRPLDARGRRQAAALVALLAPYGVTRVVTSPYERCVQTVAPLAAALGLPLEEREEIAEGTGGAVLSLLPELGPGTAFCTHGDVIEMLVGLGRPKKKGSVWLLEPRPGANQVEAVEYLPPPA
jgi:8-oxo-dGTP diphosphatase